MGKRITIKSFKTRQKETDDASIIIHDNIIYFPCSSDVHFIVEDDATQTHSEYFIQTTNTGGKQMPFMCEHPFGYFHGNGSVFKLTHSNISFFETPVRVDMRFSDETERVLEIILVKYGITANIYLGVFKNLVVQTIKCGIISLTIRDLDIPPDNIEIFENAIEVYDTTMPQSTKFKFRLSFKSKPPYRRTARCLSVN